MKNIPEWVIKIVESDDLYCNKCRKTLKVKHLISIGVQESNVEPHIDKLCIGLNCPECREMTIFELREMTLIEFAFELLDKETQTFKSKKISRKKDVFKDLTSHKSSKKIANKRSKITKREVTDIVRFLKNAKTHEDVLVAMGLSPEQISKYNYKQGEEE